MKRLFVILSLLFFTVASNGATETINWYVDGETYATTTCESGGNINLPTTPTKYGYTFQGWFSYTQLEYLESTGTQWINTGIIPRKNIKVDIDLQLKSVVSGRYIFGSWNPYAQYYMYISNGKWQWGWSSDYQTTSINADYNRHNFVLYSDEVYSYIVLDNTVIQSAITKTQSIGPSFVIFAGRSDDNNIASPLAQKIYSCKIYDNDTLVRDFIPVLDHSGVPCMYDKVEEKFYYNAGTGDFIAGPIINE
ncbi:MAG: InlB B-repeat-containing protein [Alphaproteobacteria bacterium]|nr:InlB B-repeat-containing protein [Alphaproteobacteria bacterium]